MMNPRRVCCLSLALALALIPAACSRDEGTNLEANGTAAPEVSSVDRGATTPRRERVAKPPAAPPSLPEGTSLTVRTTTALSTKTQEAGQSFTAHLEQALVVDGRVIAPKGAELQGLIIDSDRGGRVKGRSSLAVQMTRLHTAAGPTIAIATNTYTVVAEASKGKDAAKIGIGSGVGAAIGAIVGGGKGAAIGAAAGAGAGAGTVLATHGDAAVIPSETVLRFTLRAPAALAQAR
jgi:hypothetical protein